MAHAIQWNILGLKYRVHLLLDLKKEQAVSAYGFLLFLKSEIACL